MSRVIICGGGLSGSLAAIAFAKRRPDIRLLLLEREGSFGGNHIWSLFDTDLAEESRWLIDEVARRRWPDHEICFPHRKRRIEVGYNSIRSVDLDTAVRTALRRDQFRLGATISDIGPDHVVVDDRWIEADCVIDARGPGPLPNLELGWQKFVGRTYLFEQPHAVVRPVIMDATIPQRDGFRFVYLLPLSTHELLIEDTYYSSSSVLGTSDLGTGLDRIAADLERGATIAISEESGVLPVVIDGELESLWASSDSVPRLGIHGGFFHPTTGYSLPDAVANAALLTEQQDLRSAAVNRLLHGRSERLWKERRFFQLLNRMLFRAAEPDQRYRVLEHFYRLPPATIARFYAARLTALDKLRILSGRPPVSLRRALSALRARAA